MPDRYALQVSRDAEAARPVGPAPAGHADAASRHPSTVARILELQRTAGNQAVARQLAPGGAAATVQRDVAIDDVSTTVDTAGGAGTDAAGAEGGATGAGTEINDSTVRVNAGTIDLNAPIVRVGGIVQADTVIADSIVAANYTPGAGNVW